MAKRGRRLFWLRWHRRLGALVALLVVLLTVTGIALNHTADWQLSKRYLNWPWLLAWYGVEAPERSAFYEQGQWWIVQNHHLIYHDQQIATCPQPVAGIVSVDVDDQPLQVVACRERLLLLLDGELVEQWDAGWGLPVPLQGIALDEQQGLWLKSPAGLLLMDLEAGEWQAGKQTEDLVWRQRDRMPDTLQLNKPLDSPISWERWIQDLHSGRFFGPLGVWLVDLIGVVMLILALSGLWLWGSRPRR